MDNCPAMDEAQSTQHVTKKKREGRWKSKRNPMRFRPPIAQEKPDYSHMSGGGRLVNNSLDTDVEEGAVLETMVSRSTLEQDAATATEGEIECGIRFSYPSGHPSLMGNSNTSGSIAEAAILGEHRNKLGASYDATPDKSTTSSPSLGLKPVVKYRNKHKNKKWATLDLSDAGSTDDHGGVALSEPTESPVFDSPTVEIRSLIPLEEATLEEEFPRLDLIPTPVPETPVRSLVRAEQKGRAATRSVASPAIVVYHTPDRGTPPESLTASPNHSKFFEIATASQPSPLHARQDSKTQSDKLQTIMARIDDAFDVEEWNPENPTEDLAADQSNSPGPIIIKPEPLMSYTTVGSRVKTDNLPQFTAPVRIQRDGAGRRPPGTQMQSYLHDPSYYNRDRSQMASTYPAVQINNPSVKNNPHALYDPVADNDYHDRNPGSILTNLMNNTNESQHQTVGASATVQSMSSAEEARLRSLGVSVSSRSNTVSELPNKPRERSDAFSTATDPYFMAQRNLCREPKTTVYAESEASNSMILPDSMRSLQSLSKISNPNMQQAIKQRLEKATSHVKYNTASVSGTSVPQIGKEVILEEEMIHPINEGFLDTQFRFPDAGSLTDQGQPDGHLHTFSHQYANRQYDGYQHVPGRPQPLTAGPPGQRRFVGNAFSRQQPNFDNGTYFSPQFLLAQSQQTHTDYNRPPISEEYEMFMQQHKAEFVAKYRQEHGYEEYQANHVVEKEQQQVRDEQYLRQHENEQPFEVDVSQKYQASLKHPAEVDTLPYAQKFQQYGSRPAQQYQPNFTSHPTNKSWEHKVHGLLLPAHQQTYKRNGVECGHIKDTLSMAEMEKYYPQGFPKGACAVRGTHTPLPEATKAAMGMSNMSTAAAELFDAQKPFNEGLRKLNYGYEDHISSLEDRSYVVENGRNPRQPRLRPVGFERRPLSKAQLDDMSEADCAAPLVANLFGTLLGFADNIETKDRKSNLSGWTKSPAWMIDDTEEGRKSFFGDTKGNTGVKGKGPMSQESENPFLTQKK